MRLAKADKQLAELIQKKTPTLDRDEDVPKRDQDVLL